MPRLLPALLLLVLAACAAPAQAVVHGEVVSPSKVPWFAKTGICGGTLIAPDRVVTAAHCVDPVSLDDLQSIAVGGEARRATRVALPPTWERRRTGFALDDIAIVQLDRPVTSVRPAALPQPGAKVPKWLTIVGRGQIHAPAKGKEAPSGLFPVRTAKLRSMTDRSCERTWTRSKSRYRKHFEADLMLCATDDGRGAFSSVCAGDSGGPMVGGSLARPVLFGVISWTGERCGADGLPSVTAEIDRYRDFVLDEDPDWAPLASGPVTVRGDVAVGSTLTCEPPAWEVAPTAIRYRWMLRTRGKRAYEWDQVGEGATYTVRPADSGKLLECQALGTGPGGRSQTPVGPSATVRVP